MSRVLVTGINGFVGLHLALQLLQDGHSVHGTVRSLARVNEVLGVVRQYGFDDHLLSFSVAELDNDAGWAEAVSGCEYVMHVASHFPPGAPKSEDDIIRPAREGTLRVLRFARDARVRRVVMTSSFAAVGYGYPQRTKPFDETDWTNTDTPGIAPYIKSKALAERAAWDFIAQEGRDLELTAINPTGIFGPVLGTHLSTSTKIIKRMLDGEMPRCPPLHFGVVDVRDVAGIHILAMKSSQAAGKRYIAVSGEPVSMLDVATFLRRHLGAMAGKVPKNVAPVWLLKLMSLWNPQLRGMLPDLGVVRRATSDKAHSELNWTSRTAEEAIVATAESILQLEH